MYLCLPASTQFGAHSAGRERSSLTGGAVVTVSACGLRCSKATTVRSATHSLSHSTEIKAAGLIAAAGLDKVRSAALEATRLALRSVRLSRLRGSKAMSLESIVRQPMSSRLAGSISAGWQVRPLPLSSAFMGTGSHDSYWPRGHLD
jgi:hypothetical protein